MPSEEWSVQCVCGEILVISEKLRNSIVDHQTAPAPFPPSLWRESVKSEDGISTLNLSCNNCDKEIEYQWNAVMMENPHTKKRDYQDTVTGHVGLFKDEWEETLYVTPNSWVKGKSTVRKAKKRPRKSKHSNSLQDITQRWTMGHSLYYIQFTLAGIDGVIDPKEMNLLKQRMKENKVIQEGLGNEGYHDEEKRFIDAEIYYNEAAKGGKAQIVRILRDYLTQVAESHNWEKRTLSLLYTQIFDIAMADGEIWSGEVEVLQMMVDEWGLDIGIPLLEGMTDASGKGIYD